MGVEDRESLDEIDLRDLFRILLKWRWLIIGVTAASVAAAAVMSFLVLPPVYQSTMTLMVVRATDERRAPAAGDQEIESVVSPFATLPQRTIDTYIAQLTSPELLEAVQENLSLDRSIYSPSALAGLIQARHVPNTNLVEVSVEHTDRILARQIGDELAEQFLSSLEEQNRTQLDRSVVLLSQQLEEVQSQLTTYRDSLNTMRASPRSSRVVEEELSLQIGLLNRTRDALAQNQTDIASVEAMLNELSSQLGTTAATVTQTETRTGPDGQPETITREEPNPTYSQLDSEHRLQRAELARLRGESTALGQQVTQLQERVTALQAELPQVESDEQALADEVAMLEQTQHLLREKMAETQILQSIDLAGVSVLVASPSSTPTSPIRPRKTLNMAIAGMLGGMLSILLVFLLNTFDTTIRDQDDIEQLIGAPVIGHVPDFTKLRRTD